MKATRGLLWGGLVLAAVGCSEEPPLSASAQRGRGIYLAQCAACHHPSDPVQPGAIGPELTGTSLEVLEAKLLTGTYPPGYTPKRSSRIMAPMPALAPDIPALADFLRSLESLDDQRYSE